MGLNIGIELARDQLDIDTKELEREFYDFLMEKFPKGGFALGWVKSEPRWDFDVRMPSWGGKFPYPFNSMYGAILEFILKKADYIDKDLKFRVYYSG